MKSIPNKEYEEFQKYKSDKLNGRILTPDGLRFIIEANGYLIRSRRRSRMCSNSLMGITAVLPPACGACL